MLAQEDEVTNASANNPFASPANSSTSMEGQDDEPRLITSPWRLANASLGHSKQNSQNHSRCLMKVAPVAVSWIMNITFFKCPISVLCL